MEALGDVFLEMDSHEADLLVLREDYEPKIGDLFDPLGIIFLGEFFAVEVHHSMDRKPVFLKGARHNLAAEVSVSEELRKWRLAPRAFRHG